MPRVRRSFFSAGAPGLESNKFLISTRALVLIHETSYTMCRNQLYNVPLVIPAKKGSTFLILSYLILSDLSV